MTTATAPQKARSASHRSHSTQLPATTLGEYPLRNYTEIKTATMPI